MNPSPRIFALVARFTSRWDPVVPIAVGPIEPIARPNRLEDWYMNLEVVLPQKKKKRARRLVNQPAVVQPNAGFLTNAVARKVPTKSNKNESSVGTAPLRQGRTRMGAGWSDDSVDAAIAAITGVRQAS